MATKYTCDRCRETFSPKDLEVLQHHLFDSPGAHPWKIADLCKDCLEHVKKETYPLPVEKLD